MVSGYSNLNGGSGNNDNEVFSVQPILGDEPSRWSLQNLVAGIASVKSWFASSLGGIPQPVRPQFSELPRIPPALAGVLVPDHLADVVEFASNKVGLARYEAVGIYVRSAPWFRDLVKARPELEVPLLQFLQTEVGHRYLS